MAGSSDDNSIRPTSNTFTKTTDFIDRNLKVIRYVTIYGLAGVGVVLILRSTYALRKFQNVKDVPRNFVTNHMQLHGHVTEVTNAGHIVVDHAPIIKLGKGLQGHLPLRLAGVELNHLAFPWLHDNVSNKHIWFRIVRVVGDEISTSPSLTEPLLTGGREQSELIKGAIDSEENTRSNQLQNGTMATYDEVAPVAVLPPEEVLECIITAKKGFLRNMVLNEELVGLGMATVAHIDGLEGDRDITKFVTRLIKAEAKAEKKGRGIWARLSLTERLRSDLRNLKDRMMGSVREIFSWRSKK